MSRIILWGHWNATLLKITDCTFLIQNWKEHIRIRPEAIFFGLEFILATLWQFLFSNLTKVQNLCGRHLVDTELSTIITRANNSEGELNLIRDPVSPSQSLQVSSVWTLGKLGERARRSVGKSLGCASSPTLLVFSQHPACLDKGIYCTETSYVFLKYCLFSTIIRESD